MVLKILENAAISSFNEIAVDYEAYRLPYPDEFLEEIVNKASITKQAQLLEIGSGTGKATEWFAKNGFHVLCVEPAEELMKIAREKFANAKNIKFAAGKFEDLNLSDCVCDFVYSAQAFHWVRQPEGFWKCAQFLTPTGFFVPIWTICITSEDECDKKLAKMLSRYDTFCLFLTKEESKEKIRKISDEIEKSGAFHRPIEYCVPWRKSYGLSEYIGYMKTTGAFRLGTEHLRGELIQCIKDLFDKHQGVFEREFMSVAFLSKKNVF